MYINFEEVKKNNGIDNNYKVELGNFEFSNPLVNNVYDINCKYNAYVVGAEDLDLNIHVQYKVDYSDATTLKSIELSLNFEEEVCFTVNEKRAEELDIDCINQDLDLDLLVLSLINVDIPFNYSRENTKASILKSDSYNPFSNIF